jgi:hypothetical protein
MENTRIQDLERQVQRLQTELASLSQAYYKNNFTSTQVFNKASNFSSRLKVPHYDSLPATAEVGEIIEVSGKLYICSSANTFSLVGTQS